MEISPKKFKSRSTPVKSNPSPAIPATPDTLPTRRSLRLISTATPDPKLPSTPITPVTTRTRGNAVPSPGSGTHRPGRKPKRSLLATGSFSDPPSFTPVTPYSSERNKSKLYNPRPSLPKPKPMGRPPKKRVYYKKVVYGGGEFEVGDDVYVRRKEGADFDDDDDTEVEACRICYQEGGATMIECDDCLGGFHLKCLQPPLKKVPKGDWICGLCEAKKLGKVVELPKMPEGVKLRRTAREKLLSSDLWAGRIESISKETDGKYRMKCRWYMIPEETATGRQPHNLKRELYRTNHISEIEMETVLRHCYVKSPEDYKDSSNEGDDVFYCEYEYDVEWHSFRRLSEIDDRNEGDEGGMNDEDWKGSDNDANEDSESEEHADASCFTKRTQEMAANSCKGKIFGVQRVGIKKIPEHVRCHEQTDLEKAKAALMLATLPKALPCRTKEMEEINAFVKGAICDDNCLGRCLYIHGVPGTGKTMSVLSVMRKLKSEVDAGTIRPYCFIEINGLKLSSPESIYKVIYEALSGHRVGWKKALHFLNELFSDSKISGKKANRPCILLIDELDLLMTRNQSVLYNILDWPTKPHSNLVVIGIANTMDLPEKLLPRISSRMGIQKLCFGPYNHKQLHEIISSRLMGLNAFEEQAIEFASRKVAAMSGDARRALEICRRAAELADFHMKQSLHKQSSSLVDFSNGNHLVRMAEVEAAIHEVFQAPHIQLMRNSPKLAKIFLVAMVHELYRSGLGEITFEKLATTVSSLCWSNREALSGWDTLLKVGCKLAESRIIICEDGRKHRLQKLQLNFPSDDVAFALKDCSEIPWLSKYL